MSRPDVLVVSLGTTRGWRVGDLPVVTAVGRGEGG